MVPIPATEGKQMIVIGIDPHKASVTAVALSSASIALGHRRLATTAKTGAHLISWAAEWPDRLWAVEGAAGLGHGVAQQLVAAGERVVDVPARLAARARLLGSGSARKTDVTDAVSVASVAIHNPKLSAVAPEDHTVVLRLLSDRRDDVVSQRTRTMNRLQVMLRNLEPGGAPRQLSTTAAVHSWPESVLSPSPINSASRSPEISSTIFAGPTASLRRWERPIATEVAGSGTTLAEIHGACADGCPPVMGGAHPEDRRHPDGVDDRPGAPGRCRRRRSRLRRRDREHEAQ